MAIYINTHIVYVCINLFALILRLKWQNFNLFAQNILITEHPRPLSHISNLKYLVRAAFSLNFFGIGF